ncbi:MAG: stalk domain-containing protein [Peptoanaerobacter stomatis]|uniref:stalk domain-containing protein n=1 Tax=Peptoanaerobacter stomatis TaxID=796937 RepID=UPI003F9F2919
MKKKIITSILASILLSSSFVPIFADVITDPKQVEIAEQRAKEAADRIDLNIFINGQRLTFTKEENLGMPFVDKNNRTMVPVRKPIEMSGNSVVWDNKIKTAIITTKEKEIKVKLGDTLLLSKDLASGRIDKITMDTKAVTKNDRIYTT